jgi:hypothetical protein
MEPKVPITQEEAAELIRQVSIFVLSSILCGIMQRKIEGLFTCNCHGIYIFAAAISILFTFVVEVPVSVFVMSITLLTAMQSIEIILFNFNP